MDIWNDGNLKALGIKKDTKKHIITVNVPFTVTITDQDKYYNFRSILIRNDIPFTESEEMEISKN